jgi:pyruvate dehydrogenase E2 component (dihydrolipoamide acetyltransferase)
MSGIRRKIAESMSYSWTTIPHVTNFESADITNLEKLRRQFAAEVEAAGGKLTMTSILMKVISSALKVFPNFAASLDMEKAEIVLKKYCHIGVAVDTDRGLIVPVIRDVDRKNIMQLSVELIEVAERVRNKKITLEEMEGAVFTITNLGGIGGTQFSPIIHAPEVAILGVSRARHEAVFVDGKFEPRLMLPLALSYDHRLIDGADAARFLRWVVQALEQPFMLSLEG